MIVVTIGDSLITIVVGMNFSISIVLTFGVVSIVTFSIMVVISGDAVITTVVGINSVYCAVWVTFISSMIGSGIIVIFCVTNCVIGGSFTTFVVLMYLVWSTVSVTITGWIIDVGTTVTV